MKFIGSNQGLADGTFETHSHSGDAFLISLPSIKNKFPSLLIILHFWKKKSPYLVFSLTWHAVQGEVSEFSGKIKDAPVHCRNFPYHRQLSSKKLFYLH